MENSDVDLERNWKRTVKLLWLRVFLAVNKALALVVAIVIHKGLDEAAHWLLPDESWESALTLLQVGFFCVFSLVYVHFAWEVLTTFIPNIGRKRQSSREERDATENTEPVRE